jgi:hypothetical protein
VDWTGLDGASTCSGTAPRPTGSEAEPGSATVFRVTGDPHEVITVFDWDREGIEAFLADPEAPEIMAAAGLEGPPDFTFVADATGYGTTIWNATSLDALVLPPSKS